MVSILDLCLVVAVALISEGGAWLVAYWKIQADLGDCRAEVRELRTRNETLSDIIVASRSDSSVTINAGQDAVIGRDVTGRDHKRERNG